MLIATNRFLSVCKLRKYLFLVLLLMTGTLLYITHTSKFYNRLENSDFYNTMTQMAAQYQASIIVKNPFLLPGSSCKIPNMNPYEPSLLGLMSPPVTVQCSNKSPLTRVQPLDDSRGRSQLIVDRRTSVVQQYTSDSNTLSCCYSVITRITTPPGEQYDFNADNRYKVHDCQYIKDQALLDMDTEFLFAHCYVLKSFVFHMEVYKMLHAIVPVKASVKEKIKQEQNTEGLKDKIKLRSNHLNVLILGIDSISRMNFIKSMPKTYKYLKMNDWFDLTGYNKVGENTFPNVMALMTGHRVNSHFPFKLDDFPFLWKDYHREGYVTAIMEDEPDFSTFNFEKIGFVHQPVDYYPRPSMIFGYHKLATKKRDSAFTCFESLAITDYVLDYSKDFVSVFRRNKFFGLFWLNNFSHNNYNTIAGYDDTFKRYLKELDDIGTMNSTIIIFLSDHGYRFDSFLEYPFGRLQNKLPFIFIWLPKWFRELHSAASDNLRTNEIRLTSPFDVYTTLKNLIQKDSIIDKVSKYEICSSSVNLFSELPINRSCEDACIPEEFCSCTTYETVSTDDIMNQSMTKFVLESLNNIVQSANENLITKGSNSKCASLTLFKVHAISKKKEQSEKVPQYLLNFETLPGNGMFEVTIRVHDRLSKYYIVGDILRTILQDFCKLSLDFLRKGPNPKLYQTAAQKLNVSPEVIRNAVDGLVHLLVESCRNKLDEQDFQDSVLALGFSEQQQQTLSTFYHSKKEEIQSALLRPTLDIPHYKDLDWRVDIQLGSRALHHQVTPLVSMKLSLDNGQCVPLQTDPNNLLHMTQVLEQALQEAKGQHTRRIQRTFK